MTMGSPLILSILVVTSFMVAIFANTWITSLPFAVPSWFATFTTLLFMLIAIYGSVKLMRGASKKK